VLGQQMGRALAWPGLACLLSSGRLLWCFAASTGAVCERRVGGSGWALTWRRAVGSGQWAVGSGQLAAGSRQRPVGVQLPGPLGVDTPPPSPPLPHLSQRLDRPVQDKDGE